MCGNKQLLLGQQSTWHANGSGRGCQRSVGLLALHDESLCAPTKLHCGLPASQTNATTRNACEACRATRNSSAHQSCPEMLPPACHLMFNYRSRLDHAAVTLPAERMDPMQQRWHCLQYRILFRCLDHASNAHAPHRAHGSNAAKMALPAVPNFVSLRVTAVS